MGDDPKSKWAARDTAHICLHRLVHIRWANYKWHTVKVGAHVTHSRWLFSLSSEVCLLIDSFIRWDVIIGVVSILQAPKQLTSATLKLWSLLKILCLTACSAWTPQVFGNRSECLRSALDWVTWHLLPFPTRLLFLKDVFLWGFF